MDVDQRKSADVIDRRRSLFGGVALGFIATILLFLSRLRGQPDPVDPEEQLVYLVSTALDRGQAFWGDRIGSSYRRAKVVLYRDSTPTACGRGVTTSGPFYCPPDSSIYIDLSFLAAIPNGLAQAYVIAHELGHHIQNLRDELDGRPSMAVELGADCYAGQWIVAEERAGRLAIGDVTAALNEASAIGDDRICPTCSPEQWNHGSSAQRVNALETGIAGRSCAR